MEAARIIYNRFLNKNKNSIDIQDEYLLRHFQSIYSTI